MLRPTMLSKNNEYCLHLYTRYPIVARRAWPIGRVRRASKGILHTMFVSSLGLAFRQSARASKGILYTKCLLNVYLYHYGIRSNENMLCVATAFPRNDNARRVCVTTRE